MTSEKLPWFCFLRDAGIPDLTASIYATNFANNRMEMWMLPKLNLGYLNKLGIHLPGDIITILHHAKIVTEQQTSEHVLGDKDKENEVLLLDDKDKDKAREKKIAEKVTDDTAPITADETTAHSLPKVLLRETDLGQVAETSYSSSDEDGASANDDSFSSKAINTSTDMSSDSESEEEKEGGVNARSTDSELSNFDQEMEEAGQDWTCPQCLKQDKKKDPVVGEEEGEQEDILHEPTEEPVDTSSGGRRPSGRKPPTNRTRRPSEPATEKKKRGPTCHMCSNPPPHSFNYCSEKCIMAHASQVLSLHKDTDQSNKSNKTGVVLEPKTNTLLNGPNAPTQASLQDGLRDHESYHVVMPTAASSSKFYNQKKSKGSKLNDSHRESTDASRRRQSSGEKHASTHKQRPANLDLNGSEVLNGPPPSSDNNRATKKKNPPAKRQKL